ncbi:MAG TPA: biopolymer transporter ExbD [Candidatus Cloacimonadota bacterium]|nr:biopolymer transporter ExbD [Candidatus Cloacimonadota bacterium]HQH50651.1 biopolymer transporter ExbD [Candidatus Cloacimonadota bacterium]
MKIPRKRKTTANIPTTSTGDISFLLIVFFMSTTKFDVKEGVKVMLNKATQAEKMTAQTEIKLTEKEMTRIEIVENGMIKINTEEPRYLSDDDLDQIILQKVEMREAISRSSSIQAERELKMLFLVKTSPEAKYSDMVRVVDHLVPYRDRAQISISTQI